MRGRGAEMAVDSGAGSYYYFPMKDFSSHPIRLFGKLKVLKGLLALGLFLFAGVVFYLDIMTRDAIAFDVFYFPSLLLATWYLGGGAGFLAAIMTALMWFLGQWDVTYPPRDIPILMGDGVVHLFTFLLVSWMANLVHKKALLLEEKSKELARSNSELEKFACGAAHDLQSPLATIHGFAELLDERIKVSEDEEAKECVAHIEKSVKRMSAFIKALLNYARAGTREAPAVPVSFNEIVRDALGEMHFSILEKKAEVTVDPLPTLPVSPELIGMLFQNLIGNALKYCEQEPRIHIAAARSGKEWLFSVRDNGIGIPQEDQKRIFVIFEKVATPKKYPGNGIGLATCQKIIERYQGRFWVESPPKAGNEVAVPGTAGGSVFYFTLPAV